VAILGFEVERKETDHVGLNGKRFRSPTVLIRVRRGASISRNALVLGSLLIACHLADGLLTFWGIETFGLRTERNAFIQRLVYSHGTIPGLFIAKSFGVIFSLLLMFLAHQRRWLRPFLALSIGLYICLALVPWMIILTQ